jgi:lipopolysaccharide transport system ATP-binding protein
MAEVAIRTENLGKLYRLGERERYKALRDSIGSAIHAPLRLLTRRGASTPAGDNEYLWAMRRVSLEVGAGEVVGVIGRNGAGKSTLLKVLSRVASPTEGRAELWGRVGSLLEVGTGFHTELTGRENVYLSGAILGMSRAEIRRKFDEIVDFADVARFIDTPVKRYSSGMHLRLGFAVAAHLETEILLVDEVLAVGDAEFQKRCLGKMGDIAHQGRTVFFVSHNMTAINRLCPRTILIAGGELVLDGPTSEVVSEYLRLGSDENGEKVWAEQAVAPGNDKIKLRAVRVVSEGTTRSTVDIDKEVSIEVDFVNLTAGLRNLCANIYLYDSVGNVILSAGNTPKANAREETWFSEAHPVGVYRATCTFPANFLNEGRHYITVYMVTLGPIALEAEANEILAFDVFDTGVMREEGAGTHWPGAVRPRLPWRTELLEHRPADVV